MNTTSLRQTSPWAALLMVLISGCGGASATSSSSSAPVSSSTHPTVSTQASVNRSVTTSTAKRQRVPAIDMDLEGQVKLTPVSRRYTCDGENVPPPLRWGRVPRGTAELDLFILSALPVHGKFEVVWAVAGLSPQLHGLTGPSTPPAAIVGRNSAGHEGYALCPPRGSPGNYAVLLYALPRKVSVMAGFDAESLVEDSLVHVAAHEGEAILTYRK